MRSIKQEAEVTTSMLAKHKQTEPLAWRDKGARWSVFQEKHYFPPGSSAESQTNFPKNKQEKF